MNTHTALPEKVTAVDNLVVIACAPRSGSTLLLRILDSHSKIAAPCEIPLVWLFDEDDRSTPRLRDKLTQIGTHYDISIGDLLENPGLLFNTIKETEKKPILVIKHPHQSIYLDRIVATLNPKIIYLTRDFRSTAMTSFYAGNRNKGV